MSESTISMQSVQEGLGLEPCFNTDDTNLLQRINKIWCVDHCKISADCIHNPNNK